MSDEMKVSKGLEFHVVALPGVGHMPAKSEGEQDAARVSYVAAVAKLLIGEKVLMAGKGMTEKMGCPQQQFNYSVRLGLTHLNGQ